MPGRAVGGVRGWAQKGLRSATTMGRAPRSAWGGRGGVGQEF